ncbi:CFI-box-CTERM domain-containing protein [Bacillus sp. Marseille-P3661]|uniref:CFI-box-CTERM domain-containing protein n=1 Tax=Bacillus sp. Marseille-P3661 TaxID=1936234 RepID=UPI000C82F34F|nr:CFI-box-CTERM domain-containing protein [Bacillus sp. Marseille-P3661]
MKPIRMYLAIILAFFICSPIVHTASAANDIVVTEKTINDILTITGKNDGETLELNFKYNNLAGEFTAAQIEVNSNSKMNMDGTFTIGANLESGDIQSSQIVDTVYQVIISGSRLTKTPYPGGKSGEIGTIRFQMSEPGDVAIEFKSLIVNQRSLSNAAPVNINDQDNYVVNFPGPSASGGDTTPPSPPTVNPVDSDDTVVTGTAEAGSTVKVSVNGTIIGTGAATSAQSYSVSIPAQNAGTELAVTATDAANNASQPTMIVVSDATPEVTYTITVVPVVATDSKVSGLIQVEGLAALPTGLSVQLKQGNSSLGNGNVNQDGSFEIPVSSNLVAGAYKVELLNAAKEKLAENSFEVLVDECFIATASFGSKFEPSVTLLRNFRDDVLLQSTAGETFVKFYYSHSPKVANVIADSDTLKTVTRVALTPVIAAVYLTYNPVWIVLLVVAFAALWMVRRNRRSNIQA